MAVGDSVNDTLYEYWFNVYVYKPKVLMLASEDRIEELHRNIAHLSYRGLKVLFPELLININKLCEVCLKSKQTKLPLNDKKERIRYETILENVHSDIKEFIVRNFLGEKFLLTFIDESSHFTNVFVLKQRSEALENFRYYLNRMKNLYNQPGISYLYCDNGGEYLSKNEFKAFMSSEGADYKTTIRNTPALNGVAERMNRVICERVRALLLDSGLPFGVLPLFMRLML